MGKKLDLYLLVLPAMLIPVFFFAGPAVYNIALAFQGLSLFDLGREGKWGGFANFAKVLTDSSTGQSLISTTLWLAIVAVVLRQVCPT
ncbi:MAG: hypothetical protein MO852_01985, partial [Candidatus Devosia euplotis]|nr:hypothetical protein [Candidatus Devosia euplotis]